MYCFKTLQRYPKHFSYSLFGHILPFFFLFSPFTVPLLQILLNVKLISEDITRQFSVFCKNFKYPRTLFWFWIWFQLFFFAYFWIWIVLFSRKWLTQCYHHLSSIITKRVLLRLQQLFWFCLNKFPRASAIFLIFLTTFSVFIVSFYAYCDFCFISICFECILICNFEYFVIIGAFLICHYFLCYYIWFWFVHRGLTLSW